MDKPKIAVVVDDQKGIRDMLGRILKTLGYEAKLYANSLDMPCLKCDPNKRCEITDPVPDLLFMDIMMPRKNGVEKLMRLRLKGCRIKKIALMSGFCPERLHDAAKQLSCKALKKPFKIQDIKDWIEE